MSAGELAVVIATILLILGFTGLVVALMFVMRSLGELRVTIDGLRGDTRALLGEVRAAVTEASTSVAEARLTVDAAKAQVDEARDDLERFDRVLGSAEAISTSVAGASRVARAALSTPVIKTVALASGTGRAARRLRRVHAQEQKAIEASGRSRRQRRTRKART